MEHNVFLGGTQPGGLTRDYEIKFLLCHMLYKLATPLAFEEMSDILLTESIVNYFEYAQTVSELLASGHIIAQRRGEEEVYSLSDLGIKTATTFEKSIPRTVRERVVQSAQEYLLSRRIERENEVTYKKVEDGYILTLRITDIGSDLLALDIFVPNLEECGAIKARFLQDPTAIYRGIVALLTGDRSTVRLLLAQRADEQERE